MIMRSVVVRVGFVVYFFSNVRAYQMIENLLGYRITGHELGSGNFGSVFSAIDTKTQRQVVCKIMKPSSDKSREAIHRTRWLQEIDLMKQLNHVSVLLQCRGKFLKIRYMLMMCSSTLYRSSLRLRRRREFTTLPNSLPAET